MRLSGFVTLSILVAIHNAAITTDIPWTVALGYLAASVSYSVLTLAVASRCRTAKLEGVSFRFAVADILMWSAAIYCTGFERSLLFVLMILRAADHSNMGFRKVRLFACVSVGTYAALLAWGGIVEQREFSWNAEAAKLVLICGINVYLTTAARTVDKLHERIVQTQRALHHAKDSAEQASLAKSDFLAGMSHELRTPLNAIIGYSQLIQEMKDEADPDQVQADVARIEASGQHLLSLVNQVLDLAKIEAGRMTLQVTPFDPGQVIREAAQSMAPLARRRGNRIVLDVEEAAPAMVSDQLKFHQSVLNLLNNACKFTEQGDVTVRLRGEDLAGVAGVRVDVEDTGIGIEPEQRERLFQAFSQADPAIARKYGGTGLGLVLARRFCELMGGEIGLESQPKKGSRFTIWLPAEVQRDRE